MGAFTQRMGRRRATRYLLPQDAMPMDWQGAWSRRDFTLVQLSGDQVDWTETMIQRAVYRVGKRKVGLLEVRVWWVDIGPKGRQLVRLAFFSQHDPDRMSVCKEPH